MFKKLILVLLLIPVVIFAQSSGKIAGVVVDKSTGEPLPGVNVILEGTTLGASTDIDGYYVILNVPVGVYDIRANYIGYKDVVVEGVRISASLTTEINFQLEPTTLELEEAIVVTAERPLVEKNVTSSISLVTSKEIENVPVRGLQNLISLQTSVVVQDNQVHIRGSRPDEVGWYVNGAASNNILNNTQAVQVIQEAVEEFQVFAGGYTADMGGANGGIVRTELKTGGTSYHFSADYQTDRLANEGQKFLGTYSYGYQNIVGTLSGPLLSNRLKFFVAGENTAYKDRQVRFSKGYTFDHLYATAAAEPAEGLTLYYPEGFTPHNDMKRSAVNGTILLDYTKFKFRLGGAYSYEKDQLDVIPMLNILNNRGFFQTFNNLLLTGRFTHVLTPKTYYELNLSYYDRKRDREDEIFGNDWTQWFDSTANAAQGIPFASRWSPGDPILYNGIAFIRPGSPAVGGFNTPFYAQYSYQLEKQRYYGGALNFVSQIGRHHEFKAGVEGRYYTVRYFQISVKNAMTTAEPYGGMDAMRQTNALTQNWSQAGNVNNYGFDVFGDEFNGSGIDGPKHPVFGAFYVMDKIEWNDLIVNAGLRLDYYNTDDRELINPANPLFNVNTSTVEEAAFQKKDPFIQLSPRLGFSFPVTERTVFYMQYGKFVQMSELNNIYFGTGQLSRQLIGGNYYLNPVGFGLDPIRTTSYEVGFRQQISSVAAFEINGFYKNVKGQVQVFKQSVESGAFVSAYERFINQDFATTKGLEFRLTLRRTNRVQAQINYTLTSAEGTGSTETSYHGAVYNTEQTPTILSPLDYSQTHVGSVILDYRFGKNDGGPILERLGANMIFSFSSGHPYTKVTYVLGQVSYYDAGVDYMNDTRSRYAIEPIGTSVTPWTFNFDLRLDKTFSLMKVDLTVYAQIQNLFNTKNVQNVFQASGSAEDDFFLSDPTRSEAFINSAVPGGTPEDLQTTKDLYRAINLENGQAYWDYLNQQLFYSPRQIWLGIKLAY
jgi:hypothetical protein